MRRTSPVPILAPTAGVFTMLCLLLMPELAADAALDAMTLTARRLIPLLFPYSVLSALMLRRGWLPSRGPLSALYRLPGDCEGVLFSGMAAGFPVGASGAVQLYRSGRISREDAGRLAAVSSLPSPAFLTGAAGAMWESVRYGWFLWIAANLTLMIFSRLTGTADGNRTPEPLPFSRRTESFSADFTRSVTDSASACLSVVAFVVFFRVTAAVGSALIPPAGPLLTMLLEFSAGVREGAALGGIRGAAFTGASAGFGGLSVLMQIAARNGDLPGERAFSLKPYLCSRILLAAVLSAASAVWAYNFPMTAASPVVSVADVSPALLCAVPLLLILLRSCSPERRKKLP